LGVLGALPSFPTRRSSDLLLLEGDEWQYVLSEIKAPPRTVLETLLLRTVNLPRWWFYDVEPDEMFEPMMVAPRWLPVEGVLRLRSEEHTSELQSRENLVCR